MNVIALELAVLVCVSSHFFVSECESQVTIDAFDQGAMELFGAASGTSGAVDGLDENWTLGGSRFAWVRSITPPQTSLTIFDDEVPGMIMTVPALSEGAIQIGYGGNGDDPVLGVDFYANNQVGFEFIFDEAPIGSRLFIAVNSTQGQYFSDFNLMLSGPKAYRIPYTELINEFGPDSVDMNFATGLFWGIYDIPGYPTETTFSVSSLRTYSIPEAGSLSVLSLFGLAITVFRHPRRLDVPC